MSGVPGQSFPVAERATSLHAYLHAKQRWLDWEQSRDPIDMRAVLQGAVALTAAATQLPATMLMKMAIVDIGSENHVTSWLQSKLNIGASTGPQISSFALGTGNGERIVSAMHDSPFRAASLVLCQTWSADLRDPRASHANLLVLLLPLFEAAPSASQMGQIREQFAALSALACEWSTFPSLLVVSPSSTVTADDVCDILDLAALPSNLFCDIHIWNVSEDAESIDGVAMPNSATGLALELYLELHAAQFLLHGQSSRAGTTACLLPSFIAPFLEVCTRVTEPTDTASHIAAFNGAIDAVIRILDCGAASSWPALELKPQFADCALVRDTLRASKLPSMAAAPDYDAVVQFALRATGCSLAAAREHVACALMRHGRVDWNNFIQDCIEINIQALCARTAHMLVRLEPGSRRRPPPRMAKRASSETETVADSRPKRGRADGTGEIARPASAPHVPQEHQALLARIAEEQLLNRTFEATLAIMVRLPDKCDNEAPVQPGAATKDCSSTPVNIKHFVRQLHSHRAANAATEAMLEAMLQ